MPKYLEGLFGPNPRIDQYGPYRIHTLSCPYHIFVRCFIRFYGWLPDNLRRILFVDCGARKNFKLPPSLLISSTFGAMPSGRSKEFTSCKSSLFRTVMLPVPSKVPPFGTKVVSWP